MHFRSAYLFPLTAVIIKKTSFQVSQCMISPLLHFAGSFLGAFESEKTWDITLEALLCLWNHPALDWLHETDSTESITQVVVGVLRCCSNFCKLLFFERIQRSLFGSRGERFFFFFFGGGGGGERRDRRAESRAVSLGTSPNRSVKPATQH